MKIDVRSAYSKIIIEECDYDPINAVGHACSVCSYKDPGFKHRSKWAQKNMSGIVSVFNSDTYEFPTGLVDRVKWAISKARPDIKIDIIDHRIQKGYEDKFDWTPNRDPRDYQKAACQAILEKKCGVICLPTGSGKTLLAAHAIAEMGVPSVFLVHNIELLYQTYESFKEYLPSTGIGIVGDTVFEPNVVTVATLQTIGKIMSSKDDYRTNDLKNMIKNTRVVFCDEMHHLRAQTVFDTFGAFSEADVRVGLSVHSESYVELIGGPFGTGQHCKIADAFYIASCTDMASHITSDGYEIIDVSGQGIMSRGWTGDKFAWKPIKNFIRHVPASSELPGVRVYGTWLNTTNDHSIYKIVPGGRNIGDTKHQVIVSEASAQDLIIGDVLIGDDGIDWCDRGIDMIDASDRADDSGTLVCVDLTSTNRRALNLDPKAWFRFRNRGQYGHYLSLSIYKQHKNILPKPTRIYSGNSHGGWVDAYIPTVDLAYIMGYFIGDGWIDTNQLCFSICSEDVDAFISKVNSMSWLHCNLTLDKRDGSTQVEINSAILVDIFQSYFGKVNHLTKHIPGECLFSWSYQSRRQLLNGLIDSDGHSAERSRNRKRCYYTTTSYKLVMDILCLLRSIGVSGSTSPKSGPRDGGTVYGRKIIGKHPSYIVTWSTNAMNGKNNGRSGTRSKYCHSNYSFNEVQIKDTGLSVFDSIDYVYDLEMDGHPSFVANGVLVHNSATPYRDDDTDLLIEAALPRMLYMARPKEIIDAGILVPPIIRCEKFDHSKNIIKVICPTKVGKGKCGNVIEFSASFVGHKGYCPKCRKEIDISYNDVYRQLIIDNAERNQMIADSVIRAMDSGSTVAIAISKVEHGKNLLPLIPGAILLISSDSKGDRKRAFTKLKSRELKCMITTLINEGVDVPSLDLIVVVDGAERGMYIQRVGRVMRKDPNRPDKKNGLVLDIADMNCRYLSKHHRNRVKYATDEGYEVLSL